MGYGLWVMSYELLIVNYKVRIYYKFRTKKLKFAINFKQKVTIFKQF